MNVITIWGLSRNAITVGIALSLLGAVGAFVLDRHHLDSWRNVAIGVGIVGLALSLIGDVGARALKDRVDAVMLYGQPLQMAQVSLSVTFDPGEEAQKIDHPTNYVAFLKGEEVLLVASHPMTRHGQSAEGYVSFRADLDMDEASSAGGRPLYLLREVERVQIAINETPKGGRVLDGKVTCILNNAVLVEIPIRPQQVTSSGFIEFDIPKEVFANFTK